MYGEKFNQLHAAQRQLNHFKSNTIPHPYPCLCPTKRQKDTRLIWVKTLLLVTQTFSRRIRNTVLQLSPVIPSVFKI